MGAASEVFSSCSRNQRSHGILSLRLGSQHEALSQTWPCTGRRDLLALALQATPGVQPDLAEVWKARPLGRHLRRLPGELCWTKLFPHVLVAQVGAGSKWGQMLPSSARDTWLFAFYLTAGHAVPVLRWARVTSYQEQ